MDTDRLSQGQLVAAVAAIALFIISFLPWFSVPTIASVTVGGGAANQNMWEFENPLDIYLLIVILVALVPAALALMGSGGDAPMASMATFLLAGVGALLIFYQLFDHGTGVSVKVGLMLALIATIAIAAGGYLSMQEDVGGERY